MTGMVGVWTEAAFRWIHVLAGIMWIGHLWFFNFVNAQVAKTYDADSKKKVVPELMPRALYWFRWGAAYTWITGILLLGLVYYMGGAAGAHEGTSITDGRRHRHLGSPRSWSASSSTTCSGRSWPRTRWPARRSPSSASWPLAFGLATDLRRSRDVHPLGALFGTIMAANVWMRIWPAQKKIIGGVKGTSPAPDAAVAAMAGLRSKHNTYMSVPLVFFMVSNHYSDIFTSNFNWAIASGLVLAGLADDQAPLHDLGVARRRLVRRPAGRSSAGASSRPEVVPAGGPRWASNVGSTPRRTARR